MKHTLPSNFVNSPVHIALVGCGGNGSQMLTGLARMHISLLAMGHPGLELDVYDPDRVSEANIGRQLFSPADVGQYKATLLVHRLNIFFGLHWKAFPTFFSGDKARDPLYGGGSTGRMYDLVIGCVDTRASRRQIYRYGHNLNHGVRLDVAFGKNGLPKQRHYWLDVGNLSSTGQAILGEFTPRYGKSQTIPSHFFKGGKRPEGSIKRGSPNWQAFAAEHFPLHLPNVADLFPDILDETVPESDIPSCSLAQALESQDLFVNQAVTTFGLQLLWRFFRQGQLDHHGYFVNLASGQVSNLPVDRAVWRRFNPLLCGDAPAPVKSLELQAKKKTSRVKRSKTVKVNIQWKESPKVQARKIRAGIKKALK